MNKTKLYCGNCGKYGHVYRRCLSPIISNGIILFKREKNKLYYLLVQRKDTLGFVEFMRGKYNLENVNYINKLFQIMTTDERDRIITSSFDKLWNNLWMKQNNKQYHNEYDSSKSKFNKLKKGFNKKNEFISLHNLNSNNIIYWDEPEWGIPKGRRNSKENNLDCAIREFGEETGINNTDFNIIHQIDPLIELFSGSNNIRYKHIYYVAESKNYINNIEFKIDKSNMNQVSEISNIKWHSLTDALKNIRTYNIEKKNVLENLHKLLTN
jgi:8-oxo-dGTP pyrophosphatase MutT (NUDIX family)